MRARASGGLAERDPREELADLLQFLYQCPVGIVELIGQRVRRINPAAVALLAPAARDDDLRTLLPLLRRIAPEVLARIDAEPQTLGPLGDAPVRAAVDAAAGLFVDLSAVRVAPARVMLTVVDASEAAAAAGASTAAVVG